MKREPSFAFIDLVLSAVMVVGAVIVAVVAVILMAFPAIKWMAMN